MASHHLVVGGSCVCVEVKLGPRVGDEVVVVLELVDDLGQGQLAGDFRIGRQVGDVDQVVPALLVGRHHHVLAVVRHFTAAAN